jgi:hypothetical protein
VRSLRRDSASGVEPVAGEVVVNEAVAERSESRLAGVVAALDRAFPLLWIGLYLLLPVSGWASEMFDSWFDQQRDLEALRALLATGRADAIAESVIGPAYIGAAALVHEVFGLSPEDSLVALTRASYALSVAAGLLLVRVVVGRLTRATPMISLTSQLGFVALVFAAGTWYWSDVPWSHFLAAFLGVAVFAARFAPARPSLVSAGLAGALLALLAATRSFELLALVLAWGIAALAFAALRLSARSWSTPRMLVGAFAFVVTTAAVYAGTGKRDLFFLYGNHLDRQSGDVLGAEIAETPTLSLATVPVKLVQLFVDPCFYSVCPISDYKTGGGDGSNLDLWSLPLAVQLPALVFLPLCVVGVGALLVRALRRRSSWEGRTRELRLLVEMTIASCGLVVGYAASTLSGSPHLRYGFARDFLLAALLATIVVVSLAALALWHALNRRPSTGRISSESAFVLATIVSVVVVVTASVYARSSGLPRLESRHLAGVSYVARCTGDLCAIDVDARTPAGGRIAIREASTLTFGCGSERPELSLYVSRLSGGVRVPSSCANPRLVAAWPTVMGLPPGSTELRAIVVENA